MNDAQQLELAGYISDLLTKYIFQSISDDELTTLYTWAYMHPANQELFREISDPVALSESLRSYMEIIRNEKTRAGRAGSSKRSTAATASQRNAPLSN